MTRGAGGMALVALVAIAAGCAFEGARGGEGADGWTRADAGPAAAPEGSSAEGPGADVAGEAEGDDGDTSASADDAPLEVCGDGLDGDADGQVDERCSCDGGATQRCYGGAEAHAGVGACEWGTQTCDDSVEFGAWGECRGWVAPSDEVCDGEDNDCDGTVDEGCACDLGEARDCYPGPEGTAGVGQCRGGSQRCVAEDGEAGWGACDGAVGPEQEICGDARDNDCDGLVDEGCIVDCSAADVLFLMDTTRSMDGEIDEIQSRLRTTIVPGLSDTIDDPRFSVARFDDFAEGTYGSVGDTPFEMVQAGTASELEVQSAVDELTAAGGGDYPESQVEALYQVATGEGQGSYVPPASCPDGTVGHPCFRQEAARIVLLITDAPFHNGPDGWYGYSGITPRPHRYDEAVEALTAIDAKVLGLFSGERGREDLEHIARDTGAVRGEEPIVVDIDPEGTTLDSGVVEAVGELCRGR